MYVVMTFHTKPLERHRLIILICEGLFKKKTNKQEYSFTVSNIICNHGIYANKKTRVHNNVFYPSIKLQCVIWSCLLIRNIKHTNRNRKCMILHCLYTFAYLSNEWLCMFHLGSLLWVTIVKDMHLTTVTVWTHPWKKRVFYYGGLL